MPQPHQRKKMSRYRILCINKNDRYNPYERILSVGGLLLTGERWKSTQQDVIDYIRDDIHTFYVSVGGNEVEVVVAVSPYNNYYIKTEPDRAEPNNLLSLPECP